MFNVGDKIVCINTGDIDGSTVYEINIDNFYIIEQIFYNKIKCCGCGGYYNVERFVTLTEYRQMKLNKLYEKNR